MPELAGWGPLQRLRSLLPASLLRLLLRRPRLPGLQAARGLLEQGLRRAGRSCGACWLLGSWVLSGLAQVQAGVQVTCLQRLLRVLRAPAPAKRRQVQAQLLLQLLLWGSSWQRRNVRRLLRTKPWRQGLDRRQSGW